MIGESSGSVCSDVRNFRHHWPQCACVRRGAGARHSNPSRIGGRTTAARSFSVIPPRKPIEIGLGNRRLAILDLSPQGHQPMNDPATGNWIVYNGEVYNFREVRAKLERSGTGFSQ